MFLGLLYVFLFQICLRVHAVIDFLTDLLVVIKVLPGFAGPRSTVGNVSGYRCVSDLRSRGREFDSRPVPYFRGD